MKEKLIDLLSDYGYDDDEGVHIADYLLANGVIVLPCKVGDTVYLKKEYTDCPNDFENCEIFDFDDGACFMCSKAITRYSVQNVQFDLTMYYDIGKTVFLTRKEAENAVEEIKNE